MLARLLITPLTIASVLLSLGVSPTHAQSPTETGSGLWTTGLSTACPEKSYQWTIDAGSSKFRDQGGKIDVERIITRRGNGLTTQTVSSASTPAGTQWDYRFDSDIKVEVRNLSTGKSFVLSRCPSTESTLAPSDRQARARLFQGPAGRYRYQQPGYSGDMVVTEVSECNGRASLGCLGRTMFKAHIQTVNPNTHTCDVDAVENSAARISADAGMNSTFVADGANIDIQFSSGRAVISHPANGGDFGLFCGTGAYFLGDWVKLDAGPSNGSRPPLNGSTLGDTSKMSAARTSDPTTNWHLVAATRQEGAKLFWTSSNDLDTDVLDGPYLTCTRSGVSLLIPIIRGREGQQVNMVVGGDSGSANLRGTVESGPGGLTFLSELPRRHPVYALLAETGKLTFQANAVRLPSGLSMSTSPSAWRTFADACHLTW